MDNYLNKLKDCMTNLLNWTIFARKEPCSIVIVRRYLTPNGFNGELYINGKQIGVSCDNLALTGSSGVLKHDWPFDTVSTGSIVFRRGEFTERVPFQTVFVGSLIQSENGKVIKDLIKAIRGSEARLVVLERLWVES